MHKKTTEILIVTMLWIFLIISVIHNPHLRIQSLFGITSLTVVSLSLLLKKYDLSLGILFFALLLSTFNVIKFGDAYDARIGFVHLFPVILLLILVFSRFRQLMIVRERWFGKEPEELESTKENRIKIYIREFQNLSSEELVRKAENEKLVEEAKIAVEQILKERNVTLGAS